MRSYISMNLPQSIADAIYSEIARRYACDGVYVTPNQVITEHLARAYKLSEKFVFKPRKKGTVPADLDFIVNKARRDKVKMEEMIAAPMTPIELDPSKISMEKKLEINRVRVSLGLPPLFDKDGNEIPGVDPTSKK